MLKLHDIHKDFSTISSDKVRRYSPKVSSVKSPNTFKLYTVNALLSKNWFYYFFF